MTNSLFLTFGLYKVVGLEYPANYPICKFIAKEWDLIIVGDDGGQCSPLAKEE